jgi:hypothetical protein
MVLLAYLIKTNPCMPSVYDSLSDVPGCGAFDVRWRIDLAEEDVLEVKAIQVHS